ncbi:MAG: PAS domain-containing protein [Candidatus Delongbacteria bacterium]|nr:PAS domain-containing protein [Candidatus Delongbacteria bacterium]MBN2835767.1 PAS domain-containing protein [Candidatus Delongbacteria bacterium]
MSLIEDNKQFINGKLEYICPESGLKVLELEKYSNFLFDKDYYFRIKKVGDSIIVVSNKGHASRSDLKKYYEIVENFIKEANVIEPLFEIRDMKNISGTIHTRDIKLQREYFEKNSHRYAGFALCNAPIWLRALTFAGFRSLNYPVHFNVFNNYREAVTSAVQLLALEKTNSSSFLENDGFISCDRWDFEDREKGVFYKAKIIPGQIMLISIGGNITSADTDTALKKLENIYEEGNFRNREFVKIVDYSSVKNATFFSRKNYAAGIFKLNQKFNSHPQTTYICGASKSIKIQILLYSKFIASETRFYSSLNDLFKKEKDSIFGYGFSNASDFLYNEIWNFRKSENDFINSSIVIGKVLSLKISGSIDKSDIEYYFNHILPEVFREGKLRNREISVIINLINKKSTYLKRYSFYKNLDHFLRKNRISVSCFYVSGLTLFSRMIISSKAAYNMLQIEFNRNTRHSIESIKNKISSNKIDKENLIEVSDNDIMEINNFCGSLLWINRDADEHNFVSDGNPLSPLVETLEVVKKDIIELRNSEKQEKNKLESIFESIQAGIVIVEKKSHHILYMNNTAAEYAEVSRDEMIGKKCHLLICPAMEGNCPITDLGRTIENEDRVLLKKDGSNLSILKSVKNFTYDGKECLLETFIDISERKKAEEQLSIIKKALDSSDEAVMILKANNKKVYYNSKFLDLFEFSPDEIEQTNYKQMYASDDTAKMIDGKILTFGKWHGEVEMKTKSGRIFPVYSRVDSIYNNKGEVLAYIAIITESKN